MDLQRAVALSALPGISRPRAAAVFKALTDQSGGRPILLEDVVEAYGWRLLLDTSKLGGLRAAIKQDASRS